MLQRQQIFNQLGPSAHRFREIGHGLNLLGECRGLGARVAQQRQTPLRVGHSEDLLRESRCEAHVLRDRALLEGRVHATRDVDDRRPGLGLARRVVHHRHQDVLPRRREHDPGVVSKAR